MSVDTFLQPNSLWQMTEHRDGVMVAARDLGLSSETDVAIGSGGLAMHGLDAHYRSDVVSTPYTLFDADFVVSPRTVAQVIQNHPRASVRRNSLKLESGPGRPSVTLLAGELPRQIAEGLGAATSGEVARERVVVDGVATLPAHRLARAKLNAGRIQDVGGILQAHATAFGANHDILRDERWLAEVGRAVHMARDGEYSRGRMFSRIHVAPWLGQLVKADFDHPAFHAVRSNPYRQAA